MSDRVGMISLEEVEMSYETMEVVRSLRKGVHKVVKKITRYEYSKSFCERRYLSGDK